MALKIRLARGGAKKRPYYKIVVAESTSPRDGKFIERLGSHNPMLPKDHAERVVLKLERIQYWLSVGAQPTDRITKFLANVGVLKAVKAPEQTKQHLPKKKAQERMKAEQERIEAAKAAEIEAAAKAKEEAEAAAQAALAAAETPTEEAATEAPAEEASTEETPAE